MHIEIRNNLKISLWNAKLVMYVKIILVKKANKK